MVQNIILPKSREFFKYDGKKEADSDTMMVFGYLYMDPILGIKKISIRKSSWRLCMSKNGKKIPMIKSGKNTIIRGWHLQNVKVVKSSKN